MVFESRQRRVRQEGADLQLPQQGLFQTTINRIKVQNHSEELEDTRPGVRARKLEPGRPLPQSNHTNSRR
jgi:hypothetical protein